MCLDTTGEGSHSTWLAATFVGISLVLIVAFAPAASAHSDLASSDPAAGSTIDPGFSDITITFSKPSKPLGDGFALIGPNGPVTSSAKADESGTVWTLTLDSPAEEGAWQASWNITAGDTHSAEGVIDFTASTTSQDVAGEQPASDGAMSMPMPMPAGSDSMASEADSGSSGTSFLSWQLLATVGRVLWMIGLIVPAGLLSFMLWVFEGSESEVVFAERWIRLLAAIGLTGSAFELFGQIGSLSFDLTMLWGPIGIAASLRLIAGVLFVRNLHLVRFTRPGTGETPTHSTGLKYTNGGALALGVAPPPTHSRMAAKVTQPAAAAVGTAALIGSMLSDGHSIDIEPRLLMWFVTVTHIVAGAIWVGGVAALAFLLSSRWIRGHRLDAAVLGFRFSAVAGLSLGVVGVAGVALAYNILDTPAQLFTSTWGRILLLKLVAVSVAAACGAFNHFVILPEIAEFERLDPERSEATEHHLRRVGVIELAAMASALAATGWMVGSSPM